MNNVTITSPSGTTSARILVDLGFNCYQLTTRVGDTPAEVLWADERFSGGQERPSGSGIPILFPFPGRIPGTTFNWDGKPYSLPEGDGRGNAIHGFVYTRPWRVTSQAADQVTAEFQASVDDPQILEQWPADFWIQATYEVDDGRLISHFKVRNPDHRPLPFGFGVHPYFRLPLAGDSAENCLVQIPAQRRWQLVDMLPNGETEELQDSSLQQGAAFGRLTLDDVFGQLDGDPSGHQSSIRDPASGLRMVISFDNCFRELVVYTPPHRQAICIEPYTMVPGAFDLAHQGHDIGLRVLAPGDEFAARVEYSVHRE